MLQIVPVSNAPQQSLLASVSVDGKTMTLKLAIKYNEMAGYWVMSISDINSNLLVDSLALVTGSYPAANLLAQFGYLAIGSCYVINVSNRVVLVSEGAPLGFGGLDYPDKTNLGKDFQLWWDSTAP